MFYKYTSENVDFLKLELCFWNLGLQIEGVKSSFSTSWRSFHCTFLFLLPLQVEWRGRLLLSFNELNFKWLLWRFSFFSEPDPCKSSLMAIWKPAGEFELCALSLCPVNRHPVPVMFTVDPVLCWTKPNSDVLHQLWRTPPPQSWSWFWSWNKRRTRSWSSFPALYQQSGEWEQYGEGCPRVNHCN